MHGDQAGPPCLLDERDQAVAHFGSSDGLWRDRGSLDLRAGRAGHKEDRGAKGCRGGRGGGAHLRQIPAHGAILRGEVRARHMQHVVGGDQINPRQERCKRLRPIHDSEGPEPHRGAKHAVAAEDELSLACFFTFSSSRVPAASCARRTTSSKVRRSKAAVSTPARAVAITRNTVGSVLGVSTELASLASPPSTRARYRRELRPPPPWSNGTKLLKPERRPSATSSAARSGCDAAGT